MSGIAMKLATFTASAKAEIHFQPQISSWVDSRPAFNFIFPSSQKNVLALAAMFR
jgi:hypothetical protein